MSTPSTQHTNQNATPSARVAATVGWGEETWGTVSYDAATDRVSFEGPKAESLRAWWDSYAHQPIRDGQDAAQIIRDMPNQLYSFMWARPA